MPPPLHDLYKASQVALLRHVSSVIILLPLPHQMLDDAGDALTKTLETDYQQQMLRLYTQPAWCHTVFTLADALLEYMTSLQLFPWRPDIPADSVKDVTKFCIVCLEVCNVHISYTRFFILQAHNYAICVQIRFVCVLRHMYSYMYITCTCTFVLYGLTS